MSGDGPTTPIPPSGPSPLLSRLFAALDKPAAYELREDAKALLRESFAAVLSDPDLGQKWRDLAARAKTFALLEVLPSLPSLFFGGGK